MKYTASNKYVRQFKYASTNQHGDRHKEIQAKHVPMVTLSAKFDSARDLLDLVVLSDQLGVPVRYDFGEQEAYMTFVSAGSI